MNRKVICWQLCNNSCATFTHSDPVLKSLQCRLSITKYETMGLLISTLLSACITLWSYFTVMAICIGFSALIGKELMRIDSSERLASDFEWRPESKQLSGRGLVYAYWSEKRAEPTTIDETNIFGIANAILIGGTSLFFAYAIAYCIYIAAFA